MRLIWVIVAGLLCFALASCPAPDTEDEGDSPLIDQEGMRRPDFTADEEPAPAEEAAEGEEAEGIEAGEEATPENAGEEAAPTEDAEVENPCGEETGEAEENPCAEAEGEEAEEENPCEEPAGDGEEDPGEE